MVATAEATGVGRRGQATATVIQIARGIEEREKRASGAGLGWLTDPDLSRVGLAEPEWASWAKQALANYFKTKFQIQIQMLFPF
jgi:hypothetical protein